MPLHQREEGLVLRSIDYRPGKKIITIFSPNAGLIDLIIKGINQKKSHLLTLSTPFTQGEYLFRKGRSDLATYIDGTPLKTHHQLRNHLSHLQAASHLVRRLLFFVMPQKQYPLLYKLTLMFLEHLPSFASPCILMATFDLKILYHEGYLNLEQKPSFWTDEEWMLAQELVLTRTMKELKEKVVAGRIQEKLDQLIKEKG